MSKAFGLTFLSHVQLGNHNAGEGSRQLSDLKMHDGKPYISGQSFRHATRDAFRSHTAEGVDCTPKDACGRIGECKICDIFGYMNTDLDPEEGDPPVNRISPLRVAPPEGQYESPVTTDMIVQYDAGDGGDNNIGYREMAENVYRGGWMVDAAQIGRRELESIDGDADPGHRYERELKEIIDEEKRAERVQTLLDALRDATQFAGQARHMADFMPDLAVAVALDDTYNQRVHNALHVDDDRMLNVDAFESVLNDLARHGEVWVAGTYNPEVIENWDAVMDVADAHDGVNVVDSVDALYAELGDYIAE